MLSLTISSNSFGWTTRSFILLFTRIRARSISSTLLLLLILFSWFLRIFIPITWILRFCLILSWQTWNHQIIFLSCIFSFSNPLRKYFSFAALLLMFWLWSKNCPLLISMEQFRNRLWKVYLNSAIIYYNIVHF